MDKSLTDIQRINAVNRLTNEKFNTNEIYVEGKLDLIIAKKIFPKSRILREGKKKNIVQLCKKFPDNFGIVDTDYDFEGDEMTNISNICDTGVSNCMFAAIEKAPKFDTKALLGELLFLEVAKEKRAKFYFHLATEIKENQLVDKLIAFANRLTHLILFRGFVGSKYNLSVKYTSQFTWKRIISMNIEDIQKWVDFEPAIFEKFDSFSQIHSNKLSNSGINDHALENLIFSAIHFDGSLSSCQTRGEECHRTCKRTLEANLLGLIESLDPEICMNALSNIVEKYQNHRNSWA